jgi:NhaA family Na+:H+ antiporter
MFIPATDGDRSSPLARLEHFLLKPVNFIIVPIFALANTNITFSNEMIKGVTTPLGLGITIGLIVGKPIGVLLASFSSVSLGLTQLPANANWRHIVGVGLLAGIGFTMSIFLSLLSFTDSALISQAKFSVLCGSFVSASLGYLFLSRKARQG